MPVVGSVVDGSELLRSLAPVQRSSVCTGTSDGWATLRAAGRPRSRTLGRGTGAWDRQRRTSPQRRAQSSSRCAPSFARNPPTAERLTVVGGRPWDRPHEARKQAPTDKRECSLNPPRTLSGRPIKRSGVAAESPAARLLRHTVWLASCRSVARRDARLRSMSERDVIAVVLGNDVTARLQHR